MIIICDEMEIGMKFYQMAILIFFRKSLNFTSVYFDNIKIKLTFIRYHWGKAIIFRPIALDLV